MPPILVLDEGRVVLHLRPHVHVLAHEARLEAHRRGLLADVGVTLLDALLGEIADPDVEAQSALGGHGAVGVGVALEVRALLRRQHESGARREEGVHEAQHT